MPLALRIDRELKGAWVGKSRAVGMKLTDWLVGKVTGPEEFFGFFDELAAARIEVGNVEEFVRQLVTSADWRKTLVELAQTGRRSGIVMSSTDPEHQVRLRRILSSFRFDELASSTIARNVHEAPVA